MKHFKKLFLFIALFAVLALTGCADSGGSASSLKKVTNSGTIAVADDNNSYDWGNIDIKGGDKKHTFTFTNEGSDDLILKGAETSCMCTKARYRLSNGSVSPKYGMHNNPTSWATTIKPGETFDVEVIFDPMAHGPTATGTIRRSIELITSAKNDSVFELKVSGDVLTTEDFEAKQQPL